MCSVILLAAASLRTKKLACDFGLAGDSCLVGECSGLVSLSMTSGSGFLTLRFGGSSMAVLGASLHGDSRSFEAF